MTNKADESGGQSPSAKEPAEGSRETIQEELKRTERGGQQGGYHPENREGADQATADNDLTTGHSSSDDGGTDNSKQR
jgi:hypothetical protein